jgi:DNA-binding transcriptional MerR regulator
LYNYDNNNILVFGGNVVVKLYTISAVAEELGVRKHNIYQWEEAGIIPKATRSSDNKRVYSMDDIEKLREILKAKGKI